jgi:hypothetical protein
MIKDHKLTATLMVFLVTLIGIILFNPNNSGTSTVKSYPATVCPGNLGNSSSTSVIPSSKTLVRQIPSKKNLLNQARTSFYLSAKPLLVDGSNQTSINVTRSKSNSLATAICSINSGDQWFVGGSGSVTSQASIQIVNSGLSTSIVDLFVYTAKSVSPVNSVRIPKNSSKRIFIDSLAPGENSVVVHSITRSGRVTMFMYDQRQLGLQNLGSDFVSQGAAPATRVVIPAITNVALAGKKNEQMLRILAPGNVKANVKAQIVSSDGTFAPIELNDIFVKGGKVVDIKLKPILQSRNFALVLTSDRPIVAAVKSSGKFGGTNEFTWSTSVQQFENMILHLGGLKPVVVFEGKNIEVDVQWTGTNRKVYSKTIRGNKENDIATWSPKGGVVSARFSSSNKALYGGIIFKEGAGLSYLPLIAGAQLESSSVPLSDARIISR